jgi:hypothetical protein
MAQCSIGECEIMNPWLALSLRTARLGLEAHNAAIDSLFRLAKVSTSDSSEPIAVPEVNAAAPIVPVQQDPLDRDFQADGRSAVGPQAMKIHKKTRKKGRKHR